MASESSVPHSHSAGEGLDRENTVDGGLGSQKLVLTLGGGDSMAKKRNYSAPPGAFAKKQWRTAALKAKSLPDPWEGYHLDDIPEEEVTRYMYNPRSGKWKTDQVVIKMQSQSFAHGAMRECYRMKKLSKFSQHPDWRNASNYVAKRYMKETGRQVYFQDVKLQMDAKLWGEEYNKHRPPKKVDFFQTYIIEFKQRKGSPLYCVEHLIEGEYIKYNSNSGFVSDVNRLTPHAFSHFTFERSQHQLIIVDIQGVGDLYTDPQMHTVDQREYGEANLGTKGIALFFSSHICNPICAALGLTQFDLSKEDLERLQNRKWKLSSATRIHPSSSAPALKSLHELQERGGKEGGRGERGGEEGGRGERGGEEGGRGERGGEEGGVEEGSETTMRDAFQRLSLAIGGTRVHRGSGASFLGYLPPDSPLESPGITMTTRHFLSVSEDCREGEEREEEEMGDDDVIEDAPSFGPDSSERYLGPPQGGTSYSSSVQSSSVRQDVGGEEDSKTEEDSLRILGLIHLDLALYHELGRFSQDQIPDLASVWFHLETAATCTVPSALYTLAHIYLHQPHDSFKDLTIEPSSTDHQTGLQYLLKAAQSGHRAAMIEIASALDSGESEDSRDWIEAVRWYNKALETPSDASTDTSCQATESANPDYIITARLAEMYRSGGHRLEQDPNRAGELYNQAAEIAMATMKGKLANKYYMLAEEAWSEVEDQ